ncbi:MAG: Trk system potassium transporter TrkA [Clostridia bacterium]|nr:Trk system potassium transporter TrkA [Clostridia bacterium]
MRIVIIGVGKVGMTLTEYLSAEGNDVTLIDTDQEIIDNAVNSFDVNGIMGNGVNFSVQQEAGVAHADVVIATTYSDEINMLCCLVAKKIGVRHTVARIRDPEYSRQFSFMLGEMGLDMIVNPELETAREISRLLRYPYAIRIDTFAKGKVDLAEMKIAPDSPLDGMQISDIQRKLQVRILVCAVQHGDTVYIPRGDNVLYAGDHIHFTASHRDLNAFFRKMGAFHHKLKNVFIVGGGRIAYYLARQLIDLGMNVKIVEKDEARCKFLKESLPKAQIVLGDGTDQTLLAEENFADTDASIAATGIDEENIILSIFAIQQRIDKVITKISKTTLTDLLEAVGLDSVVTPKLFTANLILSYIRALQSTAGGSVQTLYKLVENQVEALEFHVEKESAVTAKPLRDLNLKKDLLICCIIRKSNIIFPGGDDVIQPGDNVIVTTTSEKLTDLEDILK